MNYSPMMSEEAYLQKTKLVGKGMKIDLKEAKANTSYFATNLINVMPYRWQATLFDALDTTSKDALVVTSRQIGKTTAAAMYALNSVINNKYPSGLALMTTVGILSATEKQALRIMRTIRQVIALGDERINYLTKGKVKKFFSSKILRRKEGSDNMSAITFQEGEIVVLPPTPSVRGFPFSLVILDEAAHIEDDNFFYDVLDPTLTKTGGRLLAFTTPNGQQGYFHELFQPEAFLEGKAEDDYLRFWFHYSSIRDERYQERMQKRKEKYYKLGKALEWQQEYDALFVSSISAFLNSPTVDSCITHESLKEASKAPCDLGLDLGMVHSKTGIVISTVQNGKAKVIYTLNLDGSVDVKPILKDLKRRFNIQRVIIDYCPESFYLTSELEKEGYNIVKFQFKTEKIPKYTQLRAIFGKKQIEIPSEAKELIKQLKGLQQIEGVNSTKIQHGTGLNDDLTDALLMSLYFFLDESDEFEVVSIADAQTTEENKGLRHDVEFDELMDEYLLWNGVNQNAS